MMAEEEAGGEEEEEDGGGHGVIRRLPDEVVVSASAALKEMLENSIDAGATVISVTVRQGGMKLLQVVDNGKGISVRLCEIVGTGLPQGQITGQIAPEDLPLVCERFATSKLQKFEDLEHISTFGFRGEALASISYVARVTVVSMVPGANCAYRASYANGVLTGGVSGESAVPKPCAGVPGTTITVEDLFYNMPTRRQASRSAADEYRAIADVVIRYSIRYPGTAFSCRKAGENTSADVRTDRDASAKTNIQLAFGKTLAQELLPMDFELSQEKVSGSAWISNANYSMKRRVFILFINGRLVDHSPLKRAIEATYAEFSPKGTFPFCYLDINMKQEDIDVNIHPTKKEVRFLHGEAIRDAIGKAIVEKLKANQSSRTYYAQTLLGSQTVTGGKGEQLKEAPTDKAPARSSAANVRPEGAVKGDDEDMRECRSGGENEEDRQTKRRKAPVAVEARGASYKDPRKLVRTDAREQHGAMKLFLDGGGSAEMGPKRRAHASRSGIRSANAPPLLTSVQMLREKCAARSHAGLASLFREHTFVGVADYQHVLVQHHTKLMIINIQSLVRELMYQKVLLQFADLTPSRLSSPVPIALVVERKLGLPSSGWTSADGDRRDVAQAVALVLFEKKDLLLEYFGVMITGESAADSMLYALPIVLDGHEPQPPAVPDLLLQLATIVNWKTEVDCFHDISEVVADCYSRPPPQHDEASFRTFERVVKHTLLPATRSSFEPPQSFVEESVVQEIASLERLYRTFERC